MICRIWEWLFFVKYRNPHRSVIYACGDNWNAMETAGAVFLPAASDRLGSDVFGVGANGYFVTPSEATENPVFEAQ